MNNERKNIWPMVVIIFVISLSIFLILYTARLESLNITWFFVFPLALTLTYLWLRLLLHVALSRMSYSKHAIPESKKSLFLIGLSLICILVSEAYFGLIWTDQIGQGQLPNTSFLGQLMLIFVPMALVWLSSFSLSTILLNMKPKQYVMLAFVLSFFNLYWLTLFFPYITGRVI